MDIKTVADGDSIAERLGASLGRHGLQCPDPEVWSDGGLPGDLREFADFTGILFIGLTRPTNNYTNFLRRLRAVVATDAKLVVVTPAADHSALLSLVRAGASDILDAQGDLDQEVGNFLARVSQASETSRGHILTVVPCYAPSDASVLAANIAAVVAESMNACGLLDFHFRGGDLALLLSLEPRHTIGDLFNQVAAIDEAMFLQAVTPHDSGIHLLAGPTTFGGTINVSASTCQQIINLAQSLWPVVVINSEDVQHAEQIRAVAVSDSVILAMGLDVVSLHRVQQHVEFLVQNHVPVDHIHLVAMGTGHPGELPISAVKQVLHAHHIHCIPDDPVAFLTSVNVGNPVVNEHPHSKASQAIRRLAYDIVGIANETNSAMTNGTTKALAVAARFTSQLLPFVGK